MHIMYIAIHVLDNYRFISDNEKNIKNTRGILKILCVINEIQVFIVTYVMIVNFIFILPIQSLVSISSWIEKLFFSYVFAINVFYGMYLMLLNISLNFAKYLQENIFTSEKKLDDLDDDDIF